MKKKLKLYILFFLGIFFVTYNVLAFEYVTNNTPKIDFNSQTKFSIYFKTSDGNPLSETNFSVYKVADIDINGRMNIKDLYDTLNIDFNHLSDNDWQNLPQTFIEYIDNNKIKSTKAGITDENGLLNFGECEKGLYLVRGKAHVEETKLYTPINYFISLPSLNNNTWIYDVKSEPKYVLENYNNLINIEIIKVWDDKGYEKNRPNEITVSLLKASKDSDDYKEYKEVKLNTSNNWTFTWQNLDNAFNYKVEELNINEMYDVKIKKDGNTFVITNKYKDNSSYLPQTGQLWWPVPILIGSGLILISIGILINHSKKDKNIHEK